MTADSTLPTYALFGSAARGGHDSFSDWDLLIVSDDVSTLKESKTTCENLGWSCTAYSWSRLQQAADDGSLFVQHSKQESRTISDSSDPLSAILSEFTVRGDYKRETIGATSLLGNLMEQLPRCDAGPMWALDGRAVGFLSLAVARLAEIGIFEFSNSGIVGGLARLGIVRKEEFD